MGNGIKEKVKGRVRKRRIEFILLLGRIYKWNCLESAYRKQIKGVIWLDGMKIEYKCSGISHLNFLCFRLSLLLSIYYKRGSRCHQHTKTVHQHTPLNQSLISLPRLARHNSQSRWWWQKGLTFVIVYYLLAPFISLCTCWNWMIVWMAGWMTEMRFSKDLFQIFLFPSLMSFKIISFHHCRLYWFAGVFWSCSFLFSHTCRQILLNNQTNLLQREQSTVG